MPHTNRAIDAIAAQLDERLRELRSAGTFKAERVLDSPQGAVIRVAGGREVINLCANNYLGLANHPAVLAAAHRALDRFGYGCASVRFICGTQSIHRELEARLSAFLGTEDTILYSSCFDANGGLFETLLDEQDAVISDALNHASIIDGIRLCKARKLRYANRDLGRTRGTAGRGAERAHAPDHHRRRVFDGRHHRAAGADQRARGTLPGDPGGR